MMVENRFKKQKKQLSIFITAGFPELNSTGKQILELQAKGVGFIEVGIPFSDPMADGLVIQETSAIALKNGMQMDLLFEQLHSIKDEVKIPLVLMGYLNPVLQYGLEKFLSKCKEINIASVILPDMSVEIYERFYKDLFDEYGIYVSFLITPETDGERIKKVVEMSQNSFVYLVSQSSITGGDSTITKEMNQKYTSIKKLCGEVPLMLGFGITSKSDVLKAQENCDGAIVGSAYLRALKQGSENSFLEGLLY
jgi:tryptophan synthase alpha chain